MHFPLAVAIVHSYFQHYEDLTLIDLPGIVRSTGKGESESLVEDTQNLIKEYMQNPRCIILAVYPANVDFHNSQIMADAKKVDAETKRTLPVITKPDLIDEGAEDGVLQLLLGRKTDKCSKGFHIVKGRGQKALDAKQSIEESLRQEEAFFRNNEPWRDVEDRQKFGTMELRGKLCALQIKITTDSFPDITKEIKDQLASSRQELSDIGNICENLSEKRHIFHVCTTAIVQSIESQFHQGLDHSNSRELSVPTEFYQICDQFKDKLHNGRLVTIKGISEGDSVVVKDGKEEFRGTAVKIEGDNIFIDPKGLQGSSFQAFHSVGSRKNDPGLPCGREGDLKWKSFPPSSIARGSDQYDVLEPFKRRKVQRDPQWLTPLIDRHRSLDLSVFLSPSVFSHIVKQLIEEDWQKPCDDLLEKVSDIVRERTVQAIKQDRLSLRYPALAAFLLGLFDEVADSVIETARAKVKHFLIVEKVPYSQNDYLTETLNRLRSEELKDSILVAFGIDENSCLDESSGAMSICTAKQIIDAIFDKNRKKSVEQHVAEDMAHVLEAYGKVVFKRFIDTVPMYCREMLLNYPGMVRKKLLQVSDDFLDRLVVESKESQRRHKELQNKIKDLEEGIKALKGLSIGTEINF
jgi:hypothetical protein